jgi:hypothetical protein
MSNEELTRIANIVRWVASVAAAVFAVAGVAMKGAFVTLLSVAAFIAIAGWVAAWLIEP